MERKTRQPEDDSGGSARTTAAVTARCAPAVALMDLEGIVVGWSAGAETSFGVAVADAVGRRLTELSFARKIPGFSSAFEQARGSAGPVTLTDVTLDFAGRTVSVALALQVVAGTQDRPATVLLTASDRAEVERLRAELHGAWDELQAATKALDTRLEELEAMQLDSAKKNEFLAMLGHELRNPLAAIVAALDLARRTTRDGPTAHALQVAHRQADYQARLVDDLLDLSRIVLGKIELRRETLDLVTIVRRAIEANRFSLAKQADVLTEDLPPGPVAVEGDATRLEQVVRNLVDNAIKYTPPGGRIGVGLAVDGTSAVLRVTDNGVGIDAGMIDAIFDLFAQSEQSLARQAGGLGIGLTLARTLAEAHRGTLTARSAGRGRGSEFELRLPLSSLAIPPGAAVSAEVPRQPRGRRVLIAEDNRDTREMLQMALQLEGHVVTLAADGHEAVRRAGMIVPDVVVLDIGLPGLDGYEVARRIRRRLGASVRLVALTGYGTAEARERAQQAGFDVHLLKPVSTDELSRIIGSG